MGFVKIIGTCLLLTIAVTLAIENGQEITLKYYFGLQSRPIPLSLLILLSFVLGTLFATLFFGLESFRLRRALRKSQHEIHHLTAEIQTLKGGREEALSGGKEEVSF